MAVTTTSNKIFYTVDGTTDTFVFTFPIIESSDLQVWLYNADGTKKQLTLDTDYTVSQTDTGGSVTLKIDPTTITGTTLLLYREVPFTQETVYPENSPFPAKSHERALDKLTMQTQQLHEKIDRALLGGIIDENLDVQNHRLINVANPQDGLDACNYQTVAGMISGTLNVHALTDKGSTVDADEILIADSADTYTNKKITMEELKSYVNEIVALDDLSNVEDSTVLAKVENVDGTGSGLDADTVDGFHLTQIVGLFFRNRIINGDFNMWQRGTDFTISANAGKVYTADRFAVVNACSVGTFTAQKTSVDNFNALYVSCVSTPAGTVSTTYFGGVQYLFEGQHLYDIAVNHGTITLSFTWESNYTGNVPVALRNLTSAPYYSYVTTFSSTADTTQNIKITIPLDYTGLVANNNNLQGFALNIGACVPTSAATQTYLTTVLNTWQEGNFLTNVTSLWSATTYFKITKVQLEKGSEQTEFEILPFEIQQFRCYRYYEIGNVGFGFPNGPAYSADTRPNFPVSFKVTKRAVPTVTETSVVIAGLDWADYAPTNISPTGYSSSAITTAATTSYVGKTAVYKADAEL